MNVLGMKRTELLALDPKNVIGQLTADEVAHIARELGAFWSYDYAAADRGRVGMHAMLKSGLHSDGFFVSKILLQPTNIFELMVHQMVTRFLSIGEGEPDYVVGIPEGATKLGERVCELLGAFPAEMKKVDGAIKLTSSLTPERSLLLVEDFCTRATGFIEAVTEIKRQAPGIDVLPHDLVILNRGGLSSFVAEGQVFGISAVAEKRINDWKPEECLLCARGSEAIKPKATEENWLAITTSQL